MLPAKWNSVALEFLNFQIDSVIIIDYSVEKVLI